MSTTQFNLDFRPRTRRADPPSSKRAIDDLVAKGILNRQVDQVWKAMGRFPGRSSKSLAEVTGMDRYMVGRRVNDLFLDGRAVKVQIKSNDLKWYAIL